MRCQRPGAPRSSAARPVGGVLRRTPPTPLVRDDPPVDEQLAAPDAPRLPPCHGRLEEASRTRTRRRTPWRERCRRAPPRRRARSADPSRRHSVPRGARLAFVPPYSMAYIASSPLAGPLGPGPQSSSGRSLFAGCGASCRSRPEKRKAAGLPRRPGDLLRWRLRRGRDGPPGLGLVSMVTRCATTKPRHDARETYVARAVPGAGVELAHREGVHRQGSSSSVAADHQGSRRQDPGQGNYCCDREAPVPATSGPLRGHHRPRARAGAGLHLAPGLRLAARRGDARRRHRRKPPRTGAARRRRHALVLGRQVAGPPSPSCACGSSGCSSSTTSWPTTSTAGATARNGRRSATCSRTPAASRSR